jgi:hypothetical protein
MNLIGGWIQAAQPSIEGQQGHGLQGPFVQLLEKNENGTMPMCQLSAPVSTNCPSVHTMSSVRTLSSGSTLSNAKTFFSALSPF